MLLCKITQPREYQNFSFFGDMATMFRTVLTVLGKDYK